MNKYLIGVVVLIIVIGVGAYAMSSRNTAENKNMATENSAMETEKASDTSMMKDDTAIMKVGSYEAYNAQKVAMAATGDVVLFFRASWCPTCRTLDADIRSHLKNIPENVTILDVNYDTETALKQKYGVTYQHTLVQVDAQGNMIKKWSGSPTLAALASEIQ